MKMIKSSLLFFTLLIVSSFEMDQGEEGCGCPVKYGEIDKSARMVRGRGDLIVTSILVNEQKGSRNVSSIVKGVVVDMDKEAGTIIVEGDQMKLKYWVIIPDGEIRIGTKLTCNALIGELDANFKKLRIDLLSGDKDQFMQLVEEVCD